MTAPGPKPTPTHLKIVKGVRKDRVNKHEPIANKVTIIKAPDWLSDEAKTIFKNVAKELRAMDLLFKADIDIIVAYCNAVVNYRKATLLVDKEGLLVEGRRDGMVSNPAVRVQRDCAMLIRQLASELGLTPSSRSRLSVVQNNVKTNDDYQLD